MRLYGRIGLLVGKLCLYLVLVGSAAIAQPAQGSGPPLGQARIERWEKVPGIQLEVPLPPGWKVFSRAVARDLDKPGERLSIMGKIFTQTASVFEITVLDMNVSPSDLDARIKRRLPDIWGSYASPRKRKTTSQPRKVGSWPAMLVEQRALLGGKPYLRFHLFVLVEKVLVEVEVGPLEEAVQDPRLWANQFMAAVRETRVADKVQVVILGGGKNRKKATEFQRKWLTLAPTIESIIKPAKGFPKLVTSGSITGLKPGFHILVLGFCYQGDAERFVHLLRHVFPGTYAKDVSGVSPACPRPGTKLELSDSALLRKGRMNLLGMWIVPPKAEWQGATGKLELMLFDGNAQIAQDSISIKPLVDGGEGWVSEISLNLAVKKGHLLAKVKDVQKFWTPDPPLTKRMTYRIGIDRSTITKMVVE